MIITDILIGDIKENFLPHRDDIDPENYRIGQVGEKIYAWNPDTDVLMEYYFDDKPENVDDLEIDHISTDCQDNRVVNLRYRSHSGNMKNTLTIEKVATKVMADGVVYNSINNQKYS